MRILALGGLAGPLLLAVVTTLLGALRPDYRHVHDFISELGATGSSYAALMNYAGFVPAGLLILGFGVSLGILLPRHRLVTIGSCLVAFLGAGIALSGVFSCDVGCPQSEGSVQNLIHNRIAPLSFASASLGFVLLGLGFRRLPSLRPLWVYSVASGVLGFVLLGALASTLETGDLTGLWQRLLLSVLFAWCAVVALRLQASTR